MGLETAAMIFGGGGALASGVGNIMQGRSQGRRARRLEDRAMGIAGEAGQPGFLENLLRSQFNTGQDGGMQMLRADPGSSLLGQLAGQPFDTSELFQALQPLRSRQLSEGVGQLRAGAPGLGQRFGSSMMQQTGDLTNQFLQGIAAQDAATQMQAHEAHQGRMFSGGMNILQMLGQAEQGRQGMQLGALQTAAGIPQMGPQNYGQPLMDIGQLLLLRQLMGGSGSSPAARGSVTPFVPATMPTFNPPSLFGG